MKKYIMHIGLVFTLLLTVACSNTVIAPFWEIPDPSLPEIAMVRTNPKGATVVYNPITCAEIGDACGFFKLHAYSHKILRHGLLAKPSDYPPSYERSADCYAAQYGKPKDIYAAYELFMDKDRNPELRIHGNPEERAETLRECAKQNNRWIGD
jgi:hypothetical protein